jgi:PAS domain S-box-containing protein
VIKGQIKETLLKIILSLILLHAFYFFNFGQSFQVRNYTAADGLPGTTVYGAVQDQWGRMWFATRFGITRYDGITWKTYGTDDGLPTLSFASLEIDGKGRIWGLPHYRQDRPYLVYFDGNRWHKIKKMEVNTAKDVTPVCFRLMKDTGLTGPAKDEPALAVATFNTGVFLWRLGKWTHLTQNQGLPGNLVSGITVIKNKFYLSTSGGLSVLSLDDNGRWVIDNQLNQTLNLPSTNLRAIAVEEAGRFKDCKIKHSRLWLLGRRWIGYFEPGKTNPRLTHYPTVTDFKKERGNISFQPDYQSGLYISWIKGMHYFDYHSLEWSLPGMSNGLVGDGTNSVYVDFEKNVWLTTNRGVSKIVSRRFSNYRTLNGLLEDEVTVVLEYEPGKFMLGHNRGVTFWDGGVFTKYPFAGKLKGDLVLCRVLDAKADSRKNIWLALEGGGVAHINRRRKFTWYGEQDGLTDYANCVWPETPDNVWIGTTGGMYFLTGNGFVSTSIDKFPNIKIRKIFGTPGKSMIIATIYSGLLVRNDKTKKWKNYRLPGNGEVNNVFAFKQDTKGRLLLGTRSGLYIARNLTGQEHGTLELFHENGFQFKKPVYFIVEDAKKRLWLGTGDGAVRWDGKTTRHYSVPQGLAGRETNRAAGLIDTEGRLWIGTNRGVSTYHENFDTHPSVIPPPKLRLLSMETEDYTLSMLRQSTSLNPQIRLKPGTHSIVFHFLGISFQDEQAVRFKYKLDGLDDDWADLLAPNRMLRYSSLAPGSYRFRIKAANSIGAWSGEALSPAIYIPAPFYKKWWFFLLMLLAAGLLLYSAARFVTQKRYAALLEKRVEERTGKLQALEKRYRNLFEESRDVVFIAAPDGAFIDINPAGVELFGYASRQDMFDDKAGITFYNEPEDRRVFEKAIRKIGFVKSYETILKNRDGERIHVRVTAALVKDEDGYVTAYRGIIRDISEQKRLEQQLLQAQKMEAIGTLAGGIAHDFNNILGVIVGYSDMLVDDLQEDSLEQRNAKSVLSAAHRATDLVKQILAFSRQSERQRKPLQLSLIVKEALKLLRSTLPSTIEIKRHINSDTGTVLADATQMHQVIMNLCANAAHAMKDGGGVLTVSLDEVFIKAEDARRHDDIAPGPYLRLTVSDTGHGIPKVVIKRIFEPYYTTKATGEGTGMGLAVLHGIVKGHGGDISVTSEPGKGAAFSVFLPLIKEKHDEELVLTDEEVTGGNEHILLIDDETALLQVGQQMLERLGYQVTGHSDPAEALETFRGDPNQFDLVITDLTMPGLTGIHIAEELKKIKPGIPVILCSGFSAGVFEEEISAYVDDFVMKPIIRGELDRVIRRVLSAPGKHSAFD